MARRYHGFQLPRMPRPQAETRVAVRASHVAPVQVVSRQRKHCRASVSRILKNGPVTDPPKDSDFCAARLSRKAAYLTDIKVHELVVELRVRARADKVYSG